MRVEMDVKKPSNPNETVRLDFWCNDISLNDPFDLIVIYGIELDHEGVEDNFMKPYDDNNLSEVFPVEDSFGYFDIGNPEFVPLRADGEIEFKNITHILMY